MQLIDCIASGKYAQSLNHFSIPNFSKSYQNAFYYSQIPLIILTIFITFLHFSIKNVQDYFETA